MINRSSVDGTTIILVEGNGAAASLLCFDPFTLKVESDFVNQGFNFQSITLPGGSPHSKRACDVNSVSRGNSGGCCLKVG